MASCDHGLPLDSAGAGTWGTLPRIRALVDVFRERDLPVIWATGERKYARAFGPATMRCRDAEHRETDSPHYELHEQIAPSGSGPVIAKSRASAFFGTQMFVVADCCFDRSAISHDVSLFDLSHEYASVLDSDELVTQLPDDPTAEPPDEEAP